VFNGCYALLLFIVLIFFLIYGVQVFFKVQGGFLLELEHFSQHSQFKQFIQSQKNFINTSQLQQSRIGLLSQTLMLSFVVAFLCSETLSEFWKNKVPLHSRNWHDLLFRVVEIGVALWFPCVLWNCMSPEQLWILNPKRIIKNLDFDVHQMSQTKPENLEDQKGEEGAAFLGDKNEAESNLCFVCSDPTDNRVCHCCFAHEPCLLQAVQKELEISHKCREYLVDKNIKGNVTCKICRGEYPVIVESARLDWLSVCSPCYLRCLGLLLCVITLSAVAVWQLNTLADQSVVAPLGCGFFILVLYVCGKCLCRYSDKALETANKRGLRFRAISPRPPPSPSPINHTLQI